MLGYYIIDPTTKGFTKFQHKDIQFYVIPYSFYDPNGLLVFTVSEQHCGCKKDLVEILEADNFETIQTPKQIERIYDYIFTRTIYVSDGAIFYIYSDQQDQLCKALSELYQYYELRY